MGLTNWFRGLRLKLLIMIILPTFVIGFLTCLAIYSVNKISNSLQESTLRLLPSAQSAGEMAEQTQRIGQALWIALGARDNVQDMDLAKEQLKLAFSAFEAAMNREINRRMAPTPQPRQRIGQRAEQLNVADVSSPAVNGLLSPAPATAAPRSSESVTTSQAGSALL